MQHLYAAFLILLCFSTTAIADDWVTKAQKEVAAEVYLSKNGIPIGMRIAGYYEGFAPSNSVPDEYTNYFDDSHPHPKNDSLHLVLNDHLHYGIISNIGSLQWVIYGGTRSRLTQEATRRRQEMERIKAFYDSVRDLPNLRSIAVFDTVLPATYVEKFLGLSGIENMVFIACEIEAEPGKFKALPNIESKVRRWDATEPRSAPKLR